MKKMNRRPWMPFYDGDFMRDTAHLSAVEGWAYLHLIMFYWANGSLPTEPSRLARIAKMDLRRWRQHVQILHQFFDSDWKHGRIEKELLKSDIFLQKQRENSAMGPPKRWPKYPHGDPQIVPRARASQPQLHNIGGSSLRSEPIDIDSSLRSESRSCSSENPIAAIPQPHGPGPPQPHGPSRFDRFYEAYPKHVDRKAAGQKFEIAVKSGVGADRIIASATRYAEACRSAHVEKRFIPSPAVWLNKGRYDDEDLPLTPRPNGHDPPAQTGRSNGTTGFINAVLDDIENDKIDRQRAGQGKESPGEIDDVQGRR